MNKIATTWRPVHPQICVECGAPVEGYAYLEGKLHGGKLPCGCSFSGKLKPEEIALALLMLEDK
jgi:hypothetical protein